MLYGSRMLSALQAYVYMISLLHTDQTAYFPGIASKATIARGSLRMPSIMWLRVNADLSGDPLLSRISATVHTLSWRQHHTKEHMIRA